MDNLRRRILTSSAGSVLITVSLNQINLKPAYGSLVVLTVYNNGEIASENDYTINSAAVDYCIVTKSGGTVTITSTTYNRSTSDDVSRGILYISDIEIPVFLIADYITYQSDRGGTGIGYYYDLVFTSNNKMTIYLYGTIDSDNTYASGYVKRETSSVIVLASATTTVPAVGQSATLFGISNGITTEGTLTRTSNNRYSATATSSGSLLASSFSGSCTY